MLYIFPNSNIKIVYRSSIAIKIAHWRRTDQKKLVVNSYILEKYILANSQTYCKTSCGPQALHNYSNGRECGGKRFECYLNMGFSINL